MTVNTLLDFFRTFWRFLLIAVLLFGLGGFVFSFAEKPVFEASQTFFVKRQTTVENKQFYTYDGYYSSQAAERFADSLFGALTSRDVLRLALSADRSFAPGEINSAINKIKVRRLSSQLVNFAYSSVSLQEARQIAADLSGFVSRLVGEFENGGDTGISVSFINPDPLIITHQPSFILNTLAGSLFGGFLSLFLAAAIYYLKDAKN